MLRRITPNLFTDETELPGSTTDDLYDQPGIPRRDSPSSDFSSSQYGGSPEPPPVSGVSTHFAEPVHLSLTGALLRPYASSFHSHAPVVSDKQSWDRQSPVFLPVKDEVPPWEHRKEIERKPLQNQTGTTSGGDSSAAMAIFSILDGSGSHPSMESNLSSLVTDESRISDSATTSISGAAEELFKTLGGEDNTRGTVGSPETDVVSPGQPFARLPKRSNITQTFEEQRFATIPPASDLPAGSRLQRNRSNEYIAERMDGSASSTTRTPSTWRDTLPEDLYSNLLARYDIYEMRRQEVIWDLCRTEEEFVDSLQIMLRLFVQPLRIEKNTSWIPGLDPDIAKLFDWLDDIAQLHADVLSTMRGCRKNQVRP
jgi:hypothetical protein